VDFSSVLFALTATIVLGCSKQEVATPAIDAAAPDVSTVYDDTPFGAPPAITTGPATPPHPTTKVGKLTVVGKLAPEVVEKQLRGRLYVYNRCYTDALQRDPTIHGQLVIRLSIDSTGAVSSAIRDPSSDLDENPKLVACVTDAISRVSFPATQGGLVIATLPLSFTPDVP